MSLNPGRERERDREKGRDREFGFMEFPIKRVHMRAALSPMWLQQMWHWRKHVTYIPCKTTITVNVCLCCAFFPLQLHSDMHRSPDIFLKFSGGAVDEDANVQDQVLQTLFRSLGASPLWTTSATYTENVQVSPCENNVHDVSNTRGKRNLPFSGFKTWDPTEYVFHLLYLS